MSNETRWIVFAAVLGLLISYGIWGNPGGTRAPGTQIAQTATQPAPVPAPAPTASAPPAEPPPPHGGTKLKFDPDSVDFGIVPLDELRTAEVRVINPTDKPIAMSEFAGSCGCLRVESSAKEIVPGKDAVLKLSFSALAGRKYDLVRACFRTDEKNKPYVTVDVHAKVKEEFYVEPDPINFESPVKNEARTRDTVVRSADGKPFAILGIAGKRPEFAFTWEPKPGGNGSAYLVHATLKSEKSGPVTDIATVSTDRPEHGHVAIHLTGTIPPDLECRPSVLTSSLDDKQLAAPFTTVMRRKTPGRLEILNVVEGPSRGVRPLPIDYVIDRLAEDVCRISIKFKDPFPFRVPSGYFMIKTNVEETDYMIPFRLNAIMKMPSAPSKKP